MSNNYIEIGRVGYPGTEWFDVDFDGGTNYWLANTEFETTWWVRNVGDISDNFNVVFRCDYGTVESGFDYLNVQQGKWFTIRDRLVFPVGTHPALIEVWTTVRKRRYSFTVIAGDTPNNELSELKITSYSRV